MVREVRRKWEMKKRSTKTVIISSILDPGTEVQHTD